MAGCNDREFMLELLEHYRRRPCLWQISHKDYHDKVVRNRALDEILPLFRTKDPEASRDTVLRKLASIRGSFNKELRKVRASVNAGASPLNVHVPKLWYYNRLSFLQDQESRRRSVKGEPSGVFEFNLDMEDSFDTRYFIDLMRDRPALWDPKNEEYSSRLRREEYWNEVYEIMFDNYSELSDGEKCKKSKEIHRRWKSLRNSFTRELARQKQPQGEGAPYRRTYMYFKRLSFLKPTINISDSRTSEMEGEEDCPEVNCNGKMSGSSYNESTQRGVSPLKKRHHQEQHAATSFSEILNPIEMVPVQQSASETEFDVWCRSLAKQMNNMETCRALQLQMQIQALVSKERIAYEKEKERSQSMSVKVNHYEESDHTY